MDMVDMPVDGGVHRPEGCPDWSVDPDQGDVGLEHFGDDRNLGRINDMVEVLVRRDDLARSDIGVGDDLVDGTHNR